MSPVDRSDLAFVLFIGVLLACIIAVALHAQNPPPIRPDTSSYVPAAPYYIGAGCVAYEFAVRVDTTFYQVECSHGLKIDGYTASRKTD